MSDGTTGGLRPLFSTDLAASVYISGSPVNINIGAVALTGNPSVSVSNTLLPVSGVVQANVTNTSPIPISGVVQATVSIGAVAVTGGNITINSGTYTPGFAILTGSQTQIPVGARSASISVISGGCYINGSGNFPAGMTLNFGGYDGRFILSSVINVGCTGSTASPSKTILVWEV